MVFPLAQAVETDPLNLLQWGALGIVLLAMLTGWIWPKPAVEGLMREKTEHKARADLIEQNLAPELRKLVHEVERLTGSNYAMATALEKQTAELHELVVLLRKAEK